MQQYLRDYHTRRVISDILPFEYNGHIYYLSSPTAEFKFYAEIIYKDIYEQSMEENISMDNIIVLLDKHKIWSEKEENDIIKSREDLENSKVTLFENYFKEEKRDIYKKVIRDLKDHISKLDRKKSSMNNLTSEYIAFTAKQRFLIGASILKPNKRRLWTNITDWDKQNKIIDTAFEKINKDMIYEEDIRDIIKNDPWKTIWSIQKKPQYIFKKPVGDFSDDQLYLSLWSVVYDNINKSNDRPSKYIIEDDDALDGWMILEKRKGEKEEGKKEISNKMFGKVVSCEEIFILADNESQIKKIYDMNSFGSKVAARKRILQTQRDGIVEEVNMLDRREQISLQANDMYARGLRSK